MGDDALVERLGACVVRHTADEHGELELRLGATEGSRFRTGIPKHAFDRLEEDLAACPTLVADDRWSEVVDYHYILQDERRARTRVVYDPDTMRSSQTHTIKRTLEFVVVQPDDDTGHAVKAARAHEQPLDDPPDACIPTHVRIKQRRCFRDVRDGACVWSYELSRTWSSSDRTRVEHLQRTCAPTYEVECELVDAGRAYRGVVGASHVAASLLLKAKLLVGADPSVPCTVVHDALERPSVPKSSSRKRRIVS